MNSTLKQNETTAVGSHETFMSSFEANLISLKQASEVELLYKKLKFLGLNFDPFNPEVSVECKQIMDNLGLTLHMQNPYLATNILLRLLDKTEEHLNNLKQ